MPPRVRRCRLRRVIEFVLYTSVLARPALAQSRFQVPEGCGTETEFRSEIERLTGGPVPPDVPSSLHIEAVGGEPGADYELRLELARESRVLRDADCRVLFRSAVVIAAAAFRGDAVPAPLPPAPVPPAPPPPARVPPVPAAVPQPAAPPARVRAPAQRSRVLRFATTPRERQYARRARSRSTVAAAQADTNASRAADPLTDPDTASERAPPARVEPPLVDVAPSPLRLGAELGLGASSGVLPDLGVKLELGARLQRGSWGAAVTFHYWPERSDSRDGRNLQVSALGGRVAALLRVAPVLDVLAGLELSRLSGEGAEGVLGRNSDVVWQVAPTLGMNFIAWDIHYLRLEIGVLGRVSVQRPRFLVTGFGELYRVPVAGGDAIIRGVWLFR
jgi:hypothetical protein